MRRARSAVLLASLTLGACSAPRGGADAGAVDSGDPVVELDGGIDAGSPPDAGPCDASLCVVAIVDQPDGGGGRATGLLANASTPETPDLFTVLLDVSTGTARTRLHRRTFGVEADLELDAGYVWAIAGSTDDFWVVGDRVDHVVDGGSTLTPCGTAVFWTGVDVDDRGALLTGNFGTFSLVCAGTAGVVASSNDGGQWVDAARLSDGGLYVVTQFGAIVRDGLEVHRLAGAASLSTSFLLRQRDDRVWAASCEGTVGEVAILFPDGGVADFDAGTCVGAMALASGDEAWLAGGAAGGTVWRFRSDGTTEASVNGVPMATGSLLLTATSLFAAGASAGEVPRVVQYHLAGR